MKLRSVNVSPLQPMLVQGEDIRTGYYKQPTEEPVAIRRIGAAGDERGELAPPI